MMKLQELLKGLDYSIITGSVEKEITSIQYDSRLCTEGGLFAALCGTNTDGHNFIERAIGSGARAVLCSHWDFPRDDEITVILTDNTRKALAAAAHNFYGYPAQKLNVIGITGTNGKTTTTFLLKSIYEEAGEKTGLLGTTGIYIGEEKIPATHTTPESLEIASHFANMVQKGVGTLAMEVSSHALSQHRADSIEFSAAAFTNLTHEHLDYHKTMDEYARAKKNLFDMLPQKAAAIAFDNSEYSEYMLRDTNAREKHLIGRTAKADIRIISETLGLTESSFTLAFGNTGFRDGKKEIDFNTMLAGRFNIDNAALAAAIALSLGLPPEIVRKGLENASGAPGRMQRILLKNGALGIVDYAHTPDALEKALIACRELLITSGKMRNKLICVFGCGGNRDTGKRPEMGKISAHLADKVVITSDNPRLESPEEIILQIYKGIPKDDRYKCVMLVSREDAIRHAVENSSEGDVILLAGKGHEDYQLIGKEKIYFDDAGQLLRFA